MREELTALRADLTSVAGTMDMRDSKLATRLDDVDLLLGPLKSRPPPAKPRYNEGYRKMLPSGVQTAFALAEEELSSIVYGDPPDEKKKKLRRLWGRL